MTGTHSVVLLEALPEVGALGRVGDSLQAHHGDIRADGHHDIGVVHVCACWVHRAECHQLLLHTTLLNARFLLSVI